MTTNKKPAKPKCIVVDCAEQWKSLRLMTGDSSNTPTYHPCPNCGRSVCSIHSTVAVTHKYRGRHAAMIYEPGLCGDCGTAVLTALAHERRRHAS